MGWLNNPSFSIDEASQRGVDVYEVLVDNWGIPSALTGGSRQWPIVGQGSISVSLAGIAIGPRSTVDRCFVSYDLQKHNVNADSHVTDRIRRLSVDAPLIFAQAADQSQIPAPPFSPYVIQAKAGPLAIYAYVNIEDALDSEMYASDVNASTVLPTTYRDVNGVLRTFTFVNPATGDKPLAAPLLHLLLYLKSPPTFVPTKRAPQIISTSSPTLIVNTECVVAQVPTYGRRNIRMMLRAEQSGGTATIDWRVGALRALSPNPTGFGAYEEPVDSALAVPFQTPVVFEPCVGNGLMADYVNVYATLKNPVATGDVHAVIQMTAYD